MADLSRLQTELNTDPLALGYAGMTNLQAANKLNALDTGRTRQRTAVPAREVLGCIDNGAWPSTGANQDKLARLLSIDPIDASNANIRGIFAAVFPNSGNTAATNQRLNALATETISRAAELGYGVVTEGEVQMARAGSW